MLYLIYISHYALNVPLADDWNMIPLASAAIHHHLTMNMLWSQYADTRIFVARLFFVAFSLFDHLNERAIILFSAGTFIAAFVLLLLLFRSYLGRPLTFMRVLLLGIVWFSLADVQNSLWSFQLAWYLVVFFFVATTYLLLVPHRHKNSLFVLGVVAAIAASLSEIQGFAVWPVGLICLLWTSPLTRRTYYKVALWVSAALVTALIYFHRFIVGNSSCVIEGGRQGNCSLRSALLHPIQLTRFFAVLVGNVVPETNWTLLPARFILPYELLGIMICCGAGFVIVQSIRQRRLQTNPLPLVLITFALLFDLMLAISHVGEGLQAAGFNRFSMPNIILLVGIVVYTLAHVPNLRKLRERPNERARLKILGFVMLTVLLISQCVVATRFGITNGSIIKADNVTTARVVVNLDRIPNALGDCEFESLVVGPSLVGLLAIRNDALINHLTVFKRNTRGLYRAEGPPGVTPCGQTALPTTATLPKGKVGVRYAAALTAMGGKLPYVWTLATGSGLLPPGLTLDPSTGVISGTPEVGGTFWFFVTVSGHESQPMRTQPQATNPHGMFITIM